MLDGCTDVWASGFKFNKNGMLCKYLYGTTALRGTFYGMPTNKLNIQGKYIRMNKINVSEPLNLSSMTVPKGSIPASIVRRHV